MSDDLRGKVRADLRTAELKKLLVCWETKRDALYDEISHQKGQVVLLEELIKNVYETILNVNKEEQLKEKERLKQTLQELEKDKKSNKILPRGVKTPRKTRKK